MSKPKTPLTMGRPTKKPAPTTSAAKGAQALEDGEVRLSVNVPTHVHRQLKIRAVERGKTVRAYLLDLLSKDGIA